MEVLLGCDDVDHLVERVLCVTLLSGTNVSSDIDGRSVCDEGEKTLVS